eukprot:gene30291-34187_t
MFARLFAPTVEVSAHCDLPCGVYDPAQARIEAESIKALIGKVADNDDPDFRTRAVLIKEERSELFGISFALGAFFAGMVLRESELSHRAAEESLPLRDAFAVLFFVSVGMLFEPSIVTEQPLKLLAVVAIVVFGKSIVAYALVVLLRYPMRTAQLVSASLAQIGEFSFILVGLGVSLGLMPTEGQSLILAGALISIATNPLWFSLIAPLQFIGNDSVESLGITGKE